jgi:aminopeptidase C
VIHAPTADKPYGRTYTVKFINNVVGGRPILYLNMDMAELKSLVLRQMQDGHVVCSAATSAMPATAVRAPGSTACTITKAFWALTCP